MQLIFALVNAKDELASVVSNHQSAESIDQETMKTSRQIPPGRNNVPSPLLDSLHL